MSARGQSKPNPACLRASKLGVLTPARRETLIHWLRDDKMTYAAARARLAANNALVQLLVEHMELERHDSGVSSFTGSEPEAGTLCFGVFQLMNICREKLEAAAEVAS